MTGRPSYYFNPVVNVGLPPSVSVRKSPTYPSSFNTLTMAVFNFDDANCTSGLPAVWALRMRVNRSATGSVMLILRPSPARLRETGAFAPEGDFADLHARQTKLAIHTARATCDRAALAHARGARVPRHCLKFCLC